MCVNARCSALIRVCKAFAKMMVSAEKPITRGLIRAEIIFHYGYRYYAVEITISIIAARLLLMASCSRRACAMLFHPVSRDEK